jgi:Tfp pilus assembly protein PilN
MGVNLLPEEMRGSNVALSWGLLLGLSAALTLALAVGVFHYMLLGQAEAASVELSDLRQTLAEMQADMAMYHALTDEVSELEQQVEQEKVLVMSKPESSLVYTGLWNVTCACPEGVWFRNMQFSSTASEIRLSGYAQSFSELNHFLRQLSHSRAFSQLRVTEVSTTVLDELEVLEFNAVLGLDVSDSDSGDTVGGES